MILIKPFHILSASILVLMALLPSSTDALIAVNRNRACNPVVQSNVPVSIRLTHHSSLQSSARRITRFENSRASIIRSAKNDKNSNVEEQKYTKVEDGSPLGVAIVLLGSLFIFASEDESLQDPTSSSVWIVFATASAAAGLARLFRFYSNEKND